MKYPHPNPWDMYAAIIHGTDEVLTNSAGDVLIHDEIIVNPGELRADVVASVNAHAHERFLKRWGPLLKV